MIRNIKEFFIGHDDFRSHMLLFALMIFFWTIFDSILQYVVPILIEEKGFSKSMIGIIISTSSIFGASFDFLICKFFRDTSFRRILILMFAICFIYPIILWGANTVSLFILAMAIWGIYFDLYGFGAFNFISHHTRKKDHAAAFGVLQIFRALGGLFGPLIAAMIIAEKIDVRPFFTGFVFLCIGFVFFLLLLLVMKKKVVHIEMEEKSSHRKNLFEELGLWRKLSKILSPVLLLTFFIFFVEAFFLTLAPLFLVEGWSLRFGGFFLAAYFLPALFVGWIVGSITRIVGKKRTAFFGLLIGSSLLSTFFLFSAPVNLLALILFASFFISLALPAINGAYADYISEAPKNESEIEGLEDFSFNLGYILGPLSAGILADTFGIPLTFSLLGAFGILVAVFLILAVPKKIDCTKV